MKIEIGPQRPQHYKESWPGEYELFSHFEFGAVVPQALSLITTRKSNGKSNACFHSGTVFTGDPAGYYAVMTGLTPNSHTYQNILREKSFCINFLSSKHYAACIKTIEHNGEDDDEIASGGLSAQACRTIGDSYIEEAVASFECAFVSSQDISGQGKAFLIIGRVQLALVNENSHLLQTICGPDGFMYNISAPQNPLAEERMPLVAAFLTPFEV